MIEQIITKILSESGYEIENERERLFNKQNTSFFLYAFIDEDDFRSFISRQSLDAETPYKVIVEEFKTILNTGRNPVIEKNSSLIILVKCSSILSLTEYQQQILLLEEDEYFLKKYVILYTDESITALTATPIVPELKTKIQNNEYFDRFAKQGYVAELEEYLVIMQLFIKLPFLNLDDGIEGFIPLSQKISRALDTNSQLYVLLLEKSQEISQLDFSKTENESKINELLSSISHD